MNHITEIKLKNFQSLQDVTMPLSPHLTVLVGPSNLGKSATFRALKALARNSPAPGLVRQGESKFEVSVEFADGTKESLTKGSKISEYVVSYPDGAGFTHAKAGATQVPEEIEKLWSLPDFCLTTQHDKPFLLDESPSEVAKILGDLTNAYMLMEAVREANRQRTEALNEAKSHQREADECMDEIRTHAGLGGRREALKSARSLLAQALAVKLKEDYIVEKVLACEIVGVQLVKARNLIASSLNIDELMSKADDVTRKVEKLSKLQDQGVSLNKQRAQFTQFLEYVPGELLKLEEEMHTLMKEQGQCPLCGNEIE